MNDKRYDLIAIGRSSIDLYSNDIGSSFEDITTFGAFVGGCPTNIAVAARRLGLKTALVTALGNDPVGDFILKFLNKEEIDVSFIPRKAARTSAVLLGIEPPDKFPLVYYRENCADIQLNIEDMSKVPFNDTRAILISGTGLSREPSRSAHLYALEMARKAGISVFLDLDFRADQWTNGPSQDLRAYGLAIRSILPYVEVAFGTEEEIKAAMLTDAGQVSISNSQISAPEVSGDLRSAIDALLKLGPTALVVKQGKEGSTVYFEDIPSMTAEPFEVEVCNVLGAGDAFAGGFIYGFTRGWDFKKAARMGNATGAIVVTRQGCANFMPHQKEVLEFIEARGGFDAREAVCQP